MSSVRLRRLHADNAALAALAQRHPRIKLVQAIGSPPDRYQVQYRVRSLRSRDGAVEPVSDHLVEITLPQGYPRLPPLCRMLTPVFHPNIAPHAICIGDHWSPGETLSSLVIRIAEMLAYQSYNTRSPLNGEAARWAEQNLKSLPLDPASMVIDDGPGPARSPAPITPEAHPAAASPAAATIELECGSCGTRMKVARTAGPVRARCPRCREVTTVPGSGG